MRTLKFALATLAAALAFGANAQQAGNLVPTGPTGMNGKYQKSDAIKASGGAAIPNAAAADAGGGIAFHAGGVAACDGCHVMHNASNGSAKSVKSASPIAPWTNQTNAYLLQGTDQSSTCLICHAGNGQQFTVYDTSATIPGNFTPGGDFRWTTQSYANSPGESHGHNVFAQDFGLLSDSGSKAPGGYYAPDATGLGAFGCSSCHDPHGRYRMQTLVAGDTAAPVNGIKFVGPFGATGSLPIAASGSYGAKPVAGEYAVGSYRLLAGKDYAPASKSNFPFASNPPVAIAPKTYNKDELTSQTVVAYGSGMSEWCANCHNQIHMNSYASGWDSLVHPAGNEAKLHTGQIDVYNRYVSSGKLGADDTNYSTLVPFEQGPEKSLLTDQLSSDASILKADVNSRVMCLSCHRAHGSAFNSMVRWDQDATFLTDGIAYTEGVATGRGTTAASATAAGYYNRPAVSGATAIGTYQRSLCNKCHGKD